MKIVKLTAAIVILAACNQPTTTNNILKWAADTKAENLKGNVDQVVTETYFIDSATGQQGKLESKTTETYNSDGYVLTFSKFTTADSSTLLSTYGAIDANGHWTSYATSKNGKPFSAIKLNVDSTGRIVAATSFDSTGKADVFYKDITVNNFGEVLGAKGYHADSTLKMSFTSTYDSLYFAGGENKDSVGKTTYKSAFTYDDKRNTIKLDETTFVKDSTTNTITTYAYNKFDDKGNWVQQTISENGKPKKIAMRTITYKS